MVFTVHPSVRLIAALVLQLSPQPIGGSAGLLVAPVLQVSGLLLQGIHAMSVVELIGKFRLAAVLQPVHRLMQQRAFERSIAAVVVAAEADPVVRRGVEPIQASRAVIQQQHPRLAGDLHLGDQSEEAQAGRCTQDFWPSFGSVPLSSLWMLLR